MVRAYALWGCTQTSGTKPPVIWVRLAMDRMKMLPVYGVTDTSSFPLAGVGKLARNCLKRVEACEKSLYFVERSIIQSEIIDI
jgi:hypothetical protein